MLRYFLAAAVLTSAAAAQTTDTPIFLSTPPQFAGTIDAATGVLTPPPPGGALLATTDDIYDNTCFGTGGNFFSNMAVAGQTRLDEGRIPSSSSTPIVGVLDSYRITQFRFGYATNEVDPSLGGPGVNIQISIYGDYDIGTGVAGAGTPLATYTFTGLNGSTTAGYAGWLYTVTVNPATLTIVADADGVYDGTPALDTFGYSYTLPTFTAGKTTGPYLTGAPQPAPCPMGDSTYYQNPTSTTGGTGLDNSNVYTRDSAGTVANFTGNANFNGGYYFALKGELDDCNNNDVPDATDIANLTSLDLNANGIPDECECGAWVTYCTSGASSNGCVPVMSAAGTPSGSAPFGFIVTCTNLEAGQNGLMFYGISGRSASPWGPSGSFQCVKGPLDRGAVGATGGTTPTACDGSLSVDWNAYITGNPTALGKPFLGGEVVNIQTWYRDPPSPKTSAMSGGLEFVVCP